MKLIGFRTVKTAIGASLAIIIAEELGLKYSAVAGIITILSVQKTRKKSFKIALKRICSTILALGVAFILFKTFGFGELIFGLFLLIFIPLAVQLNIEEGIVVSSVLVSHLLVEKSLSLFWFGNEVALMSIGITIAVALNLYMPNIEGKIKEDQIFIDESIREILLYIGQALRQGKISSNEDEKLRDLEKRLRAGRKLAYVNLNNNFFLDDSYYVKYMEMRMHQLDMIKSMKEHFRVDFSSYKHAFIMAEFTEKVANSLYEENTVENLIKDLVKLKNDFRQMSLPKSREEFEIRASLFEFLNDLEQFLKIKNDFMKEINS
ncbi:aromatic acid exporter family protein [Clostridium tetanomorphum]|uniref:Aromatic acid exporter family protein n=1 Tax=Clostridium tetanomorphum TaxID=1553 RepID=A0A923J0N2_CLOTT|nr:aromatic acid exporter family protein [Clostridium tetanomorphum]MBC2397899.1 aromatic acid exporter family protein [Clostridium tetanomorphum]